MLICCQTTVGPADPAQVWLALLMQKTHSTWKRLAQADRDTAASPGLCHYSMTLHTAVMEETCMQTTADRHDERPSMSRLSPSPRPAPSLLSMTEDDATRPGVAVGPAGGLFAEGSAAKSPWLGAKVVATIGSSSS